MTDRAPLFGIAVTARHCCGWGSLLGRRACSSGAASQGDLVAVGGRVTGSGRPPPDQKSAIVNCASSSALHPHRGVVPPPSPPPPTMDKATPPRGCPGRKTHIPFFLKLLALCSLASLTFFGYSLSYFPDWHHGPQVPLHAAEIQARCRALNTKPAPPSDFYDRTASDRFVDGTKHVWIRNATIWTGRVQGLEFIHGDVFLMNGMIKAVGRVDLPSMGVDNRDEVEILDAHGAYVTPGYVLCHQLPIPSKLKSPVHIGLSTFIHTWVLERPRHSGVLMTQIHSMDQSSLGFVLSMASTHTTQHTS